MNAALASCGQELYQIGTEAVEMLKQGEGLHMWYEDINLWPSVFSGIQAIINRITPSHRDSGAAAPVFDLLVSAGTHQSAAITLGDVEANLSYMPGTVVLVCGRVLRHEVPTWKGGERICIAHFMRDNVHERLGLPRPKWVSMDSYRGMMSSGFLSRQNSHYKRTPSQKM
jgi:hypothetical protein